MHVIRKWVLHLLANALLVGIWLPSWNVPPWRETSLSGVPFLLSLQTLLFPLPWVLVLYIRSTWSPEDSQKCFSIRKAGAWHDPVYTLGNQFCLMKISWPWPLFIGKLFWGKKTIIHWFPKFGPDNFSLSFLSRFPCSFQPLPIWIKVWNYLLLVDLYNMLTGGMETTRMKRRN